MFQEMVIYFGLIFPENDNFYSCRMKILKNAGFISGKVVINVYVGAAFFSRDAMHCVSNIVPDYRMDFSNNHPPAPPYM